MSTSLGPIHYWLYRKMRLAVQREYKLVSEADLHFDALGSELYEVASSLYGLPIEEDIPLETIIDHNHIHEWLQRTITTGEVRECTFIKDLIDTLGEEGANLVYKVFYNHGHTCGALAVTEKNTAFPMSISLSKEATPFKGPIIYKMMQNYYVNGMPCDGGDSIVEETDSHIIWVGDHRLQRENWAKASISFFHMAKAYQHWFEGFVKAINAKASFIVTETPSSLLYEIRSSR